MEIFTPNAPLPLKQVIDSSYIIYMYLLKSCRHPTQENEGSKQCNAMEYIMLWNV